MRVMSILKKLRELKPGMSTLKILKELKLVIKQKTIIKNYQLNLNEFVMKQMRNANI